MFAAQIREWKHEIKACRGVRAWIGRRFYFIPYTQKQRRKKIIFSVIFLVLIPIYLVFIILPIVVLEKLDGMLFSSWYHSLYCLFNDSHWIPFVRCNSFI